MRQADYKFLERFLDATKANLFFAKSLIMVEGDAENILLPAIADLLGYSLHKYGVSVVNVGSTAYRRYVNIFKRSDDKSFDMPIAVVSDLDVRALEYYDDKSDDRKTPKYWLKITLRKDLESVTREVDYDSMSDVFMSKTAFANEVRAHITADFGPVIETIDRLKALLNDDNRTVLTDEMLAKIREGKTKHLEVAINSDRTKIFLPKSWTLEYEIAGSGLYRLLATAIKAAAEEENNPEQEITDEVMLALWKDTKNISPDGHAPTKLETYQIFKPLNDGAVSKAITAQYLAGMLTGDMAPVKGDADLQAKVKRIVETDEKLKYLKDAIVFVTQ